MIGMIRKFWHRISDTNRLCYVLVTVFGVCLLVITLYFHFGRMVITAPTAIIELDHGYITEERLWVRVIEGLIAIGMIKLGIWKLITYRRKTK